VPEPGRYRVLLNSDSGHYGGANLGQEFSLAEHAPCHSLPFSLTLDLPPLAGLILIKDS
jgi:1,4-alpha-glucan branching enzyme